MTKINKAWVKSKEEVEIMKKAGQICAKALKEVLKHAKPGSTCSFLDSVAQKEIEGMGAKPSFMTVEDYMWTICTTVNDEVVHSIPMDRVLLEGDVLGVDIGAQYGGYHSDLAKSVNIGEISKENQKFLEVGHQTLEKAIKKAQVGGKIGDISATIQENIEGHGYQIVKSLTGHGVGKELHEEPMVPGFGKAGTGPKIEENMVLAIEVIYAMGSGDVKVLDDQWTIVTKDGSLGGLFEQTVLTEKNGPIVLTPYI
jgi:methionyl aminopeptidase